MAEQTIFFLPGYLAEPENYNFRPLVTQRLPPLLRGFPVIQLKIKNQYGVLKICHELNFFFPSESSADPDSHRINTWPPWFLLERLLFEKA